MKTSLIVTVALMLVSLSWKNSRANAEEFSERTSLFAADGPYPNDDGVNPKLRDCQVILSSRPADFPRRDEGMDRDTSDAQYSVTGGGE